MGTLVGPYSTRRVRFRRQGNENPSTLVTTGVRSLKVLLQDIDGGLGFAHEHAGATPLGQSLRRRHIAIPVFFGKHYMYDVVRITGRERGTLGR
jgi:hypothetical protein